MEIRYADPRALGARLILSEEQGKRKRFRRKLFTWNNWNEKVPGGILEISGSFAD